MSMASEDTEWSRAIGAEFESYYSASNSINDMI